MQRRHRRDRDEPEHRADRAARVQAALAPRAVGRPGAAGPADWLLDRLESDRYWPDPAQTPPELTTCAALAERAAHDAEFLQVAALYAGRPDFDAAEAGRGAGRAESVPFLPVLRYKPSGLTQAAGLGADLGPPAPRGRRRGRRDDPGAAEVHLGRLPHVRHLAAAGQARRAQGAVRQLPALPARRRPVARRRLGRLGPPPAGDGPGRLLRPDEDPRGLARRAPRAPAGRARSARLLAQAQWHNEVDPEFDLRMGDYYADFVRDEAQALGYTLEQVSDWQPPAKVKGTRGRKKSCSAETLISELLDLPDQVHQGDFVLNLSEGVTADHAAATLRDYVVTAQLADSFDNALGFIRVGRRGPQQQGGLPARQLRRGQEPLHGRAAPALAARPRARAQRGPGGGLRQARLGPGQEVPARAVPHDRRPEHGVGHPRRLRRPRPRAPPRRPLPGVYLADDLFDNARRTSANCSATRSSSA